MIQASYHSLKNEDIKIDDDSSIYWVLNEFFSADIAIIRGYQRENDVLFKHHLIEVKYNDSNVSRIIDQIKKREAEYREFGLENIIKKSRERLIKKDESFAELFEKVSQKHEIESILFHNRPGESLKSACKNEKIRLFEYKVPTISYFKEIKGDLA